VHQLVALTFLGPCPSDQQVCHGPKGRYDNSLENIGYGTLSKNNGEDKLRDGTDQRGSKSANHKLTEVDVSKIRCERASYSELARRYGVSKHCIYRVKKRLSWAWL
jgi:hypothetical protein